ncbi:hypothetical protein V8E53_007433 [Lactarius tabidus]
MLPELLRNNHALRYGDDTDTSNSGRRYARSDSQLVSNGVTMEKATTHTTDIATLASSIVMSMTAILASRVAHAAGPSEDPLSTSMPHEQQHDIIDILLHITADLDAVGSGLSPTLTVAPSMTFDITVCCAPVCLECGCNASQIQISPDGHRADRRSATAESAFDRVASSRFECQFRSTSFPVIATPRRSLMRKGTVVNCPALRRLLPHTTMPTSLKVLVLSTADDITDDPPIIAELVSPRVGCVQSAHSLRPSHLLC